MAAAADDDDEVDALAAINAELRESDVADDDPESPWLPLESNPVSRVRLAVYLCVWCWSFVGRDAMTCLCVASLCVVIIVY